MNTDEITELLTYRCNRIALWLKPIISIKNSGHGNFATDCRLYTFLPIANPFRVETLNWDYCEL